MRHLCVVEDVASLTGAYAYCIVEVGSKSPTFLVLFIRNRSVSKLHCMDVSFLSILTHTLNFRLRSAHNCFVGTGRRGARG